MKIITYNVWAGSKPMKPHNEDRFPFLRQALENEQPDIVCLQEANEFDSNNYEKITQLKERLNLPFWHLAQGTKRSRGRYHVALLSRYSIIPRDLPDHLKQSISAHHFVNQHLPS